MSQMQNLIGFNNENLSSHWGFSRRGMHNGAIDANQDGAPQRGRTTLKFDCRLHQPHLFASLFAKSPNERRAFRYQSQWDPAFVTSRLTSFGTLFLHLAKRPWHLYSLRSYKSHPGMPSYLYGSVVPPCRGLFYKIGLYYWPFFSCTLARKTHKQEQLPASR